MEVQGEIVCEHIGGILLFSIIMMSHDMIVEKDNDKCKIVYTKKSIGSSGRSLATSSSAGVRVGKMWWTR